jgi:uncharacterized small protein (DUF1192 family)
METKAIKGSLDYVKDEETGTILFINKREVERHKAALQAKKAGRERINILEREVKELKGLVTKLLENR